MRATDWDGVADQYSKVQDTRFLTVFPAALQLIRGFGCKRLLDFGAGDGSFIKMWLSSSEGTAVAYDPSARMRGLASEALSEFAHRCRVVSQMDGLVGSFDVATMIAVWMSLPTREACVTALKGIGEALDDDGHLVAAVTHPCFRDRQFATFRTSFCIDDYLAEGSSFEVTVFDGENVVELSDFHWSLGEMTSQLREAGFVLTHIVELPDIQGGPWPRSYPWLVLVGRKERCPDVYNV